MGLWLKVAIRHKRRLPTGFPPFIPFALLTQSPTFCSGVAVNFFFKEKVFLSFCSRSGWLPAFGASFVAEAFIGSKFLRI